METASGQTKTILLCRILTHIDSGRQEKPGNYARFITLIGWIWIKLEPPDAKQPCQTMIVWQGCNANGGGGESRTLVSDSEYLGFYKHSRLFDFTRRTPSGRLPHARSSQLIVRTGRGAAPARQPALFTPSLPPAGVEGEDGPPLGGAVTD